MKLFKDSFEKKKEPSFEDGNPALVQAMEAVARNDNAGNRTRLYTSLFGATLFVAVAETPKGLNPGAQTLTQSHDPQIRSNVDANGIRVLPAFTDIEALRNWDANTAYLGVESADLFRFVLGNGIQVIVINPFDPAGKMIRTGGRITRREIEQLATGAIPANNGFQKMHIGNEKILVGRAEKPPSAALQELLRGKALDLTEIAELYFFQMAREQRPASAVIGVFLNQPADNTRRNQIMRALATAIQSHMHLGQFLDFMIIEGSFTLYIRSIGGLIFRRS